MFHNTFVIPAYIHPMAAGGANLMYMGALYYGVPVIMGRQLWGMGLAGVPRRYALLGEDAPAS